MLSHDNTLFRKALNIYYLFRAIVSRIYADTILSGTNERKLAMPFQVLVGFIMSIIN